MARKKDLEKHPIRHALIEEPKYFGIGLSFLKILFFVALCVVWLIGLCFQKWFLTLIMTPLITGAVYVAFYFASKKDVIMPDLLRRHLMQQKYYLPHPRVDRKGEKTT